MRSDTGRIITEPPEIRGDVAGLLTTFLPLEVRYPGLYWMHPATMLRDGTTLTGGRLHYEVAFRDGGALGDDEFPGDDVRLPLHRRECLTRIAEWLAEGERCRRGCPVPLPNVARNVAIGVSATVTCCDDGYLRKPHFLHAFLPRVCGGRMERIEDSALLLGASVRRVLAGWEPISVLYSEWRNEDDDELELPWKRIAVAWSGDRPATRKFYAGHEVGKDHADAHFLGNGAALTNHDNNTLSVRVPGGVP